MTGVYRGTMPSQLTTHCASGLNKRSTATNSDGQRLARCRRLPPPSQRLRPLARGCRTRDPLSEASKPASPAMPATRDPRCRPDEPASERSPKSRAQSTCPDQHGVQRPVDYRREENRKCRNRHLCLGGDLYALLLRQKSNQQERSKHPKSARRGPRLRRSESRRAREPQGPGRPRSHARRPQLGPAEFASIQAKERRHNLLEISPKRGIRFLAVVPLERSGRCSTCVLES